MSQKVQKTHSQNSNSVPSQTPPQNPPPFSFQDDPQAKYGAGTSGSDGGGPGGKKILDPELAKPKHEPPRPKHDAPSQKEYGFDEGEKFDDSKFAGPPEFCGLLMPPPPVLPPPANTFPYPPNAETYGKGLSQSPHTALCDCPYPD